MADLEKPSTKTGSGAPPESPTTARPLDFDDDLQETPMTATANEGASSTAPKPTEDVPPPKPPRPLSPREQAEMTLREAFPSIDASVIKAVLAASGGQVEPAFNALLGMTDPDSMKEPEPPAKPPRPTAQSQSQVEADEMYARQLAEHYSGVARQGTSQQQRSQRQPRPGEEEREHSFFDDDIPVIRENLRKGFLETQSTVNKWVQNFKKKLDGEDEEDEFNSAPARPAQGQFGRGGSSAGYGRRSGETGRRSADRERYDADPQVLGDDFATLELRDSEAPPPRPARPLANPDLFKPTPSPPAGRKVAFHDGAPDEIQGDMYSAETPKAPGSAGKTSKWQPLATVDPSPVAENDPFSLGDSDDDKEVKPKDQSDEAERLQKATAEAMSEEIGGKDDTTKPSS